MNKRKIIGILLIIFIFIGLGITVAYVITELNNEKDIEIIKVETTDAMKFKSEYEDLNNKEVEEGKKYRSVSIDDNNPIKYTTSIDVVNRINNRESFIVYFGFDSCPWCRSIIEMMLKSAKDNNISTIYYVDIKNIRDKYELNDNNEAVRTVEGTDGYYSLLEKLDNVLSKYEPLSYTTKKKGKTVIEEVEIEEKRIYAPNIVIVKNGEAVKMITGISPDEDDPYMELTPEMLSYSLNEFNNLFEEYNKELETTMPVCDGQHNC